MLTDSSRTKVGFCLCLISSFSFDLRKLYVYNKIIHYLIPFFDSAEVMKGLKAKKNGKLDNIKDFLPPESAGKTSANSDSEAASTRSTQSGKSHQQV